MLRVLNSSTAKVPKWSDDSNWEWQSIDITEQHEELHRLLAKWSRSGSNLLTLFKENSELRESCCHGTTLLSSTRDGVAQLTWFPHRLEHKHASQKDRALTQFIESLVNPLAWKLGGPCAGCNRFYLKNTKRQIKYCSRGCSTNTTAQSATKRRREAEYSEKLFEAQLLIQKWSWHPRREKWKPWVAAKSKRMITEKWLTRAVNLGKLSPPIGR